MKTFEDLTRRDVENLLKLSYLEGINDCLTNQSRPNKFFTLETFRINTKEK